MNTSTAKIAVLQKKLVTKSCEEKEKTCQVQRQTRIFKKKKVPQRSIKRVKFLNGSQVSDGQNPPPDFTRLCIKMCQKETKHRTECREQIKNESNMGC